MGLYDTDVPKEGLNPITGEATAVLRCRLTVERDLPYRQAYADLIEALLTEAAYKPPIVQ